MKCIPLTLLIGISLLTACGGVPSAPTTTSIPFMDSATPSPLPSTTRTSLPFATPTASVTPLPTIPTFTPTFDVSTIVTVTPAPQAECPGEEAALSFNPQNIDRSGEDYNQQFKEYTLDYLNSGGSIQSIRMNYAYPDEVIQKSDLTGDGVGEVIFAFGIWLNIFGCNDGEFYYYSARL